MTEKSPAFQFYPQDWLSSARVAEMSLEEEGVYIRLLCYCWTVGSIPADPERCAKLAGKGCSVETATVVQRSFNGSSTDPQRMVHDRLEKERKKQETRRAFASKAGKKSAESRSRRSVTTRPETTKNERSTNVQRKVNSSSSSSDEDELCFDKRKEFSSGGDDGVPFELDHPEFHAAWKEWCEHRKEMKKKLTPRSKKMQLKRLAAWGVNGAVASITESIACGWSGLFEPKPERLQARKRQCRWPYDDTDLNTPDGLAAVTSVFLENISK